MILRDYQIQSIDNLRQSVSKGNRRPVIQSPTGSGKTVLAAALVQMARDRGKKVMFTVPALSLIDQTVERFASQGIHCGVIQADHYLTNSAMPVQVASVQTLARRTIPLMDLVIVDECHMMFELYHKWFNDPAWQKIPIVGLTATPWQKGMGQIWDDLIIGTTTQELIDKGYLSDFKVFAPGHKPDLKNIRMIAGDYDKKQLGRVMDDDLLVADIVSTWLERAKGRPTICFAVNRLHAKHLQKQFEDSGVKAAYMDAYTKPDDRRVIVEQFAAQEVEIICNVGVLTTGFDADVRCIILARPTKSEILYTQMIGRGLRQATGKDHCLILDHSDTTLRLGFVTDIHYDYLDAGTKNKSTNKSKELLPKECPKCAFLRPPKTRVCPSCGHVPDPKSDITTGEGELIELDRKTKERLKNELSIERRQEFYSELIQYAKIKNYKSGWAFYAYKDKFGTFPPNFFHTEPKPMSFETANWVKHRNIARAKARAKLAGA
jgi:superfamily II DNA or RNA helicase